MSKLIQRDFMTFAISSPARGVPLLLGLFALAGCASSPQHQRFSGLHTQTTSNFFPQRIYGAASPRVVADGEEVPTGGGRYHLGKPYRIAGRTYVPSERPIAQTGLASWYGSDFHGRRTANGEVFDLNSISAAHPTMPLPSYARVTNLSNAHSIVVRVNDRGPYHGGRVMDVSQRVAEALDFHSAGTAHVKVEWIGGADLSGGDSARLMATLRDDGAPAQLDGFETPPATLTAGAEEAAPAPRRATRTKQIVAPDEAPTRLASMSGKLDESMTAYAPTERRRDIAVAPTPRENVASKPTLLDNAVSGQSRRVSLGVIDDRSPERAPRDKPAPVSQHAPAGPSGVDATPVATVRARDEAAPLPPSRPYAARGKQAARSAIGDLPN